MNVLTKNYMEFVKNISLSDAEIRKSCDNARKVCSYLDKHLNDLSFEIIGSFAKNTETTSQIDLVIKTSNPSEIRKLLLENYTLSGDLTVEFENSKVNVILGRGDEIRLNNRWVQNETALEIERINESEAEGRNNTRDLIKIIKHWRDLHDVDMSSYFIEREAVDYMTTTTHDSDSYFLYGFMIMKFFEKLIGEPCPSWISDVKMAYELTEKGVKLDKKEDSIRCFREVFGEEFPETVYELDYDEYVM